MGTLDIEVRDQWNFLFHLNEYDEDIAKTEKYNCHYCSCVLLDKTYCYIINQLKESGLLNKDYKPICCYCKIFKQFGLMDLRRNLNTIFYYEYTDILEVQLTFPTRRSIPDSRIMWNNVDIRIHDWSKVKI